MNGTELSQVETKINEAFDKALVLITVEGVANQCNVADYLGITKSTFSQKLKGSKAGKFSPSQKMKVIQYLKEIGKKIEKI